MHWSNSLYVIAKCRKCCFKVCKTSFGLVESSYWRYLWLTTTYLMCLFWNVLVKVVSQVYHTEQQHIDYVEPWAHRYCDDMWTIFKLHIYIWLVPVLIIPRSCSIIFVPDYSSWPLWCILWYMVLRKYCTVHANHGYVINLVLFHQMPIYFQTCEAHRRQHTVYDRTTCMRREFWSCCQQCTWWLSCKSSMYSSELK